MSDDLLAVLDWNRRIQLQEDLHLQDLCISTVQRNIQVLIRHVQPERMPATYRTICPGCGRGIELKQG